MKIKTNIYNYILFPLLTILYLLTIFFTSAYKTNETIKERYRPQEEIVFQIQKEYREKNILEKLPDDFEIVLNSLNVDLNYKELVTLLNYGYVFLEQNSQKSLNFYNIISENDNIFLSCNTMSHYLSNKREKSRVKNIEKRESGKLTRNILLTPKEIENITSSVLHTTNIQPLYRTKILLDMKENRNLDIRLEDCIYTDYIIDSNQIDSTYLRTLILLNTIIDIDNIKIKDDIKYGYILKVLDKKTYIGIHFTKDDTLTLDNNNFSSDYDIQPKEQTTSTVRIPVLMYHHIDVAPSGSNAFREALYVSPDIFEKQIAYLTRKNYKSISTDEFYNLLLEGKNPDQKTVLITFDDSTPSHYSAAFPILKKYRHTGVFFVPSRVGLLNDTQLLEMHFNDMDIQNHSATHPDLRRVLSKQMLSDEIVGSKESLEGRIGKKIYSFAYPGCVGSYNVFKMVEDSGYSLGFSCGTSIDHNIEQRIVLSRRQVTNSVERLVEILSGF